MTDVHLTTDAVKDALQQQQAQADATHKLEADSHTGFSLGAAIESGMSHAVSFVEGALDYLPGLHLTDSAPPATQKAEAQPAAAPQTKPETQAPGIADITKHFASVEHSDKSFTLTDYLKSAGFDKSTACQAESSPAPAPLTLNGINYSITKGRDNIKMGQAISIGETAFDKTEWQDVFAVINAQKGSDTLNLSNWKDDTTARAEADDTAQSKGGTTEKTTDGYVHRNAQGQVDFERRGDLEIKHNPSGTTSEFDLKTHQMALKDAHGKPMFVMDKEGLFKGFTKDGTEVVFSKDAKTATFIAKDGTATPTLVANGEFTTVVNETKVVGRNENALKSLPSAFATVDHLLDGRSGMVTFADSKWIKGNDGLSMFVGLDGTSAVSLDAHSQVIRSPQGDISIIYNDNRPMVKLSVQQVNDMLAKHSKEAAVLAAVIQRLRDYGATGVLRNASGGVLKKSAEGVSANLHQVLATSNGGQTIVTNQLTQQSQVINIAAQTDKLVDADGKEQGTLDFSGKTTSFKTPDWEYKGGLVTTSDGTVYSQEGIKFADGTAFHSNGTITDSSGMTYNSSGEAIAFEKPAADSSSDTSKNNEETQAKAQVSQAESMASSILGKVSGGHATAGDIAALLGSFEKLTALVGSLAQFSDPSLMATAVIAQGEVAGSLEIAYATLNRNADKAIQAPQNAMVAA